MHLPKSLLKSYKARDGVMVLLDKNILSYDFSTGKMGSVKPPPTKCNDYYANNLYLATSSDRKLLKLLAIEGFMMRSEERRVGKEC